MKVCIAVFLIWMLATSVSASRADDLVKQETRVADAVAKYGVTGNGVIVAVMDRGIDWQNNDFRNSDGSTRIAYIFDLTDDLRCQCGRQPLWHGNDLHPFPDQQRINQWYDIANP